MPKEVAKVPLYLTEKDRTNILILKEEFNQLGTTYDIVSGALRLAVGMLRDIKKGTLRLEIEE